MASADVEMPVAPVQSLRKSLERFDLRPATHSSGKNKLDYDSLRANHQQERQIRNEIIVNHVQSWMEPTSKSEPVDILRLFECIERLVHLMDYSFSGIIWQMLCYAERYVQSTKLVRRSELFQLLVVSVCVAMKMWEDYGPDLDLTAQVCGIPKKRIAELERAMLEKCDFRLTLDESDVENFKRNVVRPTAGCA